MSRSAEEWAERVPWQRLSPRSKETKERIATLIADGHTQEEVAGLVGLDTREVAAAMQELREETRALIEGARLPPLPDDTREAMRDSIERLGQLVPVLVDEEGHPLDGSNRLAVLEELGIEPVVRVIDTQGDQERRREIRLATNTVRRQLSMTDVQRAIAAELVRDPARSNRAIAAELGTNHHAVSKVRTDLEERGSLLRLQNRTGLDGKSYTKRPQPGERRKRKTEIVVAADPPAVVADRSADELSCRLEVDPSDTAGGRLAFVGPVRLELPEKAWRQLGQPLALTVTLASA